MCESQRYFLSFSSILENFVIQISGKARSCFLILYIFFNKISESIHSHIVMRACDSLLTRYDSFARVALVIAISRDKMSLCKWAVGTEILKNLFSQFLALVFHKVWILFQKNESSCCREVGSKFKLEQIINGYFCLEPHPTRNVWQFYYFPKILIARLSYTAIPTFASTYLYTRTNFSQ